MRARGVDHARPAPVSDQSLTDPGAIFRLLASAAARRAAGCDGCGVPCGGGDGVTAWLCPLDFERLLAERDATREAER